MTAAPAPTDGGTQGVGPVRFPIPALITRYIADRRRKQTLSAATARDVRYTLTRFAENAPSDIRKVTKRHIEQFIERSEWAVSTRRRALSELRGFFRWAVLEGHARRDPTLAVEPAQQPPTVPGALTSDVAEQLHIAYQRLPDRERLMISLELNEALRRVELARAQIADVDRRGRAMRVRGKARGGKGDVTRTVPLSDETLLNLSRYLASEPPLLGLAQMSSGPLFRNRHRPNEGLTATHIGKLVGDALYELGIKSGPRDGISGHALRHTAATEALEAGVPIEVVQRFLGHLYSKTTDHYTRGAVFDLRQIHEAREHARAEDTIDLRDE